MQHQFLSYDIRGIQSFVFAVPKLRYIIGGSATIDAFDRSVIPRVAGELGVTLLYAAGGKGTLCCSAAELSVLHERIRTEAHANGLDVRLATSPDFRRMEDDAWQLFSHVPTGLVGQPCAVSGQYPVDNNCGIHPLIERRVGKYGVEVRDAFEKPYLTESGLEQLCGKRTPTFFHSVREDEEAGAEARAAGRAGAAALGNRNRWAVICMDGNDMGAQFRKAADSQDDLAAWIKEFSQALLSCTHEAVKEGIRSVVDRWLKWTAVDTDGSGELVLPIRPLVVGGDDLIVLCHPMYALDFVKATSRAFQNNSRLYSKHFPATGGEVTISAGVLYAPVHLPLHSALEFAESLLASAKARGRGGQRAGAPAPACVDWECVTESLLEAPADRRHRELVFSDEDLHNQRVELTRRPYTLDELAGLEKSVIPIVAKAPRTIVSGLQSLLQQPYWERRVGYESLRKHQRELCTLLDEHKDLNRPNGTRWRLDEDGVRRTDVLDAALLLQEQHRAMQETI